MNKTNLIERVADDLKTSKLQAGIAVDAVMQAITQGIQTSDRVVIPGFGTFIRSPVRERNGRNPHTGEVIRLKASMRVGFRCGSKLKALVSGATPNAH